MGDHFNFNIKEFDMSKVGDGKVIVFIGKRNSGKSVLAVNYLYHNQDIPVGTCISATDEFNQTYKGKVPDMFIHEEYSAELIEKFVHRQQWLTRKKKNKSSPDWEQYRDVDNRAFLIFDDLAFDSNTWVKDKNVKFIFMNGRHVGITFLITMQYMLGIPPSLRTNVDYIFICRENKVTMKKKLYDHYAGMFPDYNMFSQVLAECTKDFGCLVIDNVTKSEKLEDQVFWYKADISKHNNFRLCDDSFWISQPRNEIIEDEEDDVPQYKPKYTKYTASKPNYSVSRVKNQDSLVGGDYNYYY